MSTTAMAKFREIREAQGTTATISFQKDSYEKEGKTIDVAKAWDNERRVQYVLPIDVFTQAKANPEIELVTMVTDRISKASNMPYKNIFCFIPEDTIGSL